MLNTSTVLRVKSIKKAARRVTLPCEGPLAPAYSSLRALQAAAFPVPDYSYNATLSVFDTIFAHKWATGGPSEFRVGVWNTAAGVFKSFLDVTEEDITNSLQVNVNAAFAFSRRAVLKFRENALDERGKRGTLIFTGATAAIRGNVLTSAFAAGKFGTRALSQSLAKEFGKENIHVAHVRTVVISSVGHGVNPS